MPDAVSNHLPQRLLCTNTPPSPMGETGERLRKPDGVLFGNTVIVILGRMKKSLEYASKIVKIKNEMKERSPSE